MPDTCPTCGGTGYEVRARADGATVAVRCECTVRDQGDRLLRAARIPRRYEHCTLDEFKVRGPSHVAALNIAKDWVARWPGAENGLLFYGQPGTGKTHLAVGIAMELTRTKGARVLFYEQRELLKALQGTFDSNSTRTEADVFGPVLDAEVLVLDDVGAGRTTPWARDVMHEIISHRYNQKLLLIMTSNRFTGENDEKDYRDERPADVLTLRDRLGDALMSRIYEMCRLVPLEGEDFRRRILHADIRS